MSQESPGIKDSLRGQLVGRRMGIDPRQRVQLDKQICIHLADFLAASEMLDLAAYVAFKGEPDLFPVLGDLHRAGRRVHLPVLAETRQTMAFHRWHPGVEMPANRFGIPEPVNGQSCPAQRLGLVLTPLVAFSPNGVRLGMGAGFYDRTFQFKMAEPANPPLLMGVAYGVQEVDNLPAESWDVPLDGITTEHGTRFFQHRY